MSGALVVEDVAPVVRGVEGRFEIKVVSVICVVVVEAAVVDKDKVDVVAKGVLVANVSV